MKLSFVLGGAVGYVLGAKAGRERYEAIVRGGRRLAGSQTVQSAAGVFQAQVDDLTRKVRDVVMTKVSSTGSTGSTPNANGASRH